MSLKFFALLLRLLGLLPLLTYPAVLVANLMQAAALLDSSRAAVGSRGQRAAMGVFVGGTTIYSLVLLACRLLAARANNATRELTWSAAPLLFIAALAALFALIERGEARN